MWIYIIIGVVVVILIYAFSLYNSLIKLNNKVKEAFSTMDVYLKKRWDLIPNVVETVKGYAKHEKETLQEVTALRNNSYENMSEEEKFQTNAQLSSGVHKILALAEAYPDLKANENFKDLSDQLTKVEDDIANSRKYYNGTVKRYNMSVQTIPTNIIAGMFHFEKKPMFEVESQAERQNVKVKFD